MAKVVLVAENLNPTVQRLLIGLCNQMHSVTFVTSRSEDGDIPERVNVMRPFRRWSALEAMRILPLLYTLNPQIIHMVLDDSQVRAAHVMIAFLAKALPHTVLSTSLLHIGQGLRRRNPTRYLLQESDIVTCPSVEALGTLRGLNIRSSRQGRGILPPMLNVADDVSLEKSAAISDLIERMKDRDFLAVPFSEPEFDPDKMSFRRIATLAPHRHLVLMGSTANWNLRERKRFELWMKEQGLESQWTFTGHLNSGDLRRVLAVAEGFVLAGQNLTPFETAEYFLHALHSGVTLLLDDKQSTVHADLWRHGENCWILPSRDLLKALQDRLSGGSVKLPQALPSEIGIHRDLIDAPLNELNRLYNRALTQKA